MGRDIRAIADRLSDAFRRAAAAAGKAATGKAGPRPARRAEPAVQLSPELSRRLGAAHPEEGGAPSPAPESIDIRT